VEPTLEPTEEPTAEPTLEPTEIPTEEPTAVPTEMVPGVTAPAPVNWWQALWDRLLSLFGWR